MGKINEHDGNSDKAKTANKHNLNVWTIFKCNSFICFQFPRLIRTKTSEINVSIVLGIILVKTFRQLRALG